MADRERARWSTPRPLARIDKWWRAANYLSVGQIYLLDNPLLREPLTRDHVKPRLLGHWGTTPGLNFLYAHLNRAIAEREQSTIYVTGPGHGGPGLVASAYLDGTYSEFYSDITEDTEGIHRLFRQFSFPGGIPSHVAPETPGSIHEGGELGLRAEPRLRRRVRQPGPARRDRRRRRRGGDRPAGHELALEQVRQRRERRRRPADPAPQRLQDRQPDRARAHPRRRARRRSWSGYGHKPHMFVAGFDDESHDDIHRRFATLLDEVLDEIAEIKRSAHAGNEQRPQWPMIVFRTPKGWTGPDYIDGKKTDRVVARAPGAAGQRAGHPRAPRRAAARGSSRTGVERAVRRGRPAARRHPRARPDGRPADERQPARQRRAAAQGPAPAGLPRLRGRRAGAGRLDQRGAARAGRLADRRHPAQPGQLPDLRPRRDGVEPPAVGVRDARTSSGTRSSSAPDVDEHLARAGRVHGDAQRAPVPGLARGLPADRPARPVQLLRGVHPHHRLDVQPARQVAEGHRRDPVAPPDREPQLPAVQPRLAPGPQRLQPPGPGVHRPRGQQEGRGRPGLPAAGRQHAAVDVRPLPAQPAVRQRGRRGQAAGAELPDHGPGRSRTARAAWASGTGRARRCRARSRTSCSAAPATCRRSRCWPRRTSCAASCPTSRSA